MPGFTNDPWGQVGQLQDILRNYQEEDILKELLQNADDAEASRCWLSLHPGLTSSPHPLLATPALLVANDGHFKKEDGDAITRLRLGSKAGDAETIGRFGLGLKSIFHLCEAFFIFADTDGEPYHHLLNPWADIPHFHEQWEACWSSSKEKLQADIRHEYQHWLRDWKRKFLLWIPLRQKNLLHDKEPLAKNFPSADCFPKGFCQVEGARCLPFLKNIMEIRMCRWQGTDIREDWQLTRAKTLKQDSPTGLEHDPLELRFGGSENTGTPYHCVRQRRALKSEVTLNQLQADENWPTEPQLDKGTGTRSTRKVSLAREAGVAFLQLPHAAPEPAHFYMTFTSHLPIRETRRKQACELSRSIELLIHGGYVLDSGRTRLEEGQNSETKKLESQWNLTLIEHALRQVLPAFSDFCQSAKLEPAEIQNCTATLGTFFEQLTSQGGDKLLKAAQPKLWEKHQWLYVLEDRQAAWRLIDHTRDQPSPYWELPAHKDPSFPFSVFPGLEKLAKKCHITFVSCPRLTGAQAHPWEKDSNELKGLLQGLQSAPGIRELEHFDYLLKFMELQADQLKGKNFSKPLQSIDWDGWVKLFSSWLADKGLELYQPETRPWQKLLKQLPKDSWVSLELVASRDRPHELDNALKAIWGENLTQLILPESPGDRHDASESQLLLENAVKILSCLAKLLEPKGKRTISMEFAARATVQVWKRCSEQSGLAQRCGELKLFRVYSYHEEKEDLLSWQELERLRKKEQLFLSTSNTLANALQEAMPDSRFYRLVEDPKKADVSTVLYTMSTLPECDEEFCAKLLSHKPSVKPLPAARVELLKKLVQGQKPSESILKAARYLIHRHPDHYDDLETPLFMHADRDSLWSKLSHELRSRLRQHWRSVPPELNQGLDARQQKLLRIEAEEQSAVEKQLLSNLTEAKRLVYDEETCLQLLRSLQDEKLWYELRIHKTLDGRFMRASEEHTYREGSRTPSPAVAHLIILLKTPSELRATRYDRLTPYDITCELKVLLAQSPLSQVAEALLTLLDEFAETGRVLESSPCQALRGQDWLPLDKSWVAPDKVLYLPPLDELIGSATEGFTHLGRIPASLLPPSLLKRPAWRVLRPILLPEKEVLDYVVRCMAKQPRYCLGIRAERLEHGHEQKLFEAILLVGEGHFPALPLLHLVQEGEHSSSLSRYLRQLCGPIETEHGVPLLKRLAELLQAQPEHKILQWFHRLLLEQQLERPSPDRAWLRGLPLPSRAVQWSPAEALCMGLENVAPEAVLADRLHESFRPATESEGRPNVATTSSSSHAQATAAEAEKLLKYLAPLRGKADPPVFGVLLAVLGTAFEQAAEEHLAPHYSVKIVRERLDVPEERQANSLAVGANDSLAELIETVTFQVLPAPPKDTRVRGTNLLGEVCNFAMASKLESIFAGRPTFKEGRYSWTLAPLSSTERMTSAEVSQLIQKSIEGYVKKVLLRSSPHLADLFEELGQSEQVELEVTQDIILEGVPHYAPQLGRQHIPALKEWLDQWQKLRYDAAAHKHPAARSKGHAVDAAQKAEEDLLADKQKLLHRLKERLQSDATLHQQLLKAVRAKITSFQYSPESVLFELFQNADDAVSELYALHGEEDLPAGLDRLELRIQPDSLTFIHYGRNINQLWAGKSRPHDGHTRGYERDLEKMLTLMASDKSADLTSESRLTTGHFGLGFKSVFLLCDRPQVLSGRMAIQIVGGLYPQTLEESQRQTLENLGPGDWKKRKHHQGTVFHLPGVSKQDATQAVGPFLNMLPLLLIFARRVKAFRLLTSDGPDAITRLQDKALMVEGMRRLRFESPKHSLVPTFRGVELRLRPGASLVLGLGNRGIQPLHEAWSQNGASRSGVPGFWVTAPTQEEPGLGFALNGPFELDAGRQRLAGLDGNRKLATELGRALGERLVALWVLSTTDWKALRAEMELLPIITCDAFWASVWEVICVARASRRAEAGTAQQLLHTLLWSKGAGLAALLEQEAAIIPTGFEGTSWGGCTSLQRIRWIVDESLLGKTDRSSSERRLQLLSDPLLISTVGSRGALISQERYDQLQAVNSDVIDVTKTKWKILTFEVMVGTLMDGDNRVTPERLKKLVQLLTEERLNTLKSDFPRQYDEVLKRLRDFLYQNREGVWRSATDLLIDRARLDEDKSYEGLRHAFAPAEYSLHEGYTQDQLFLFKLSRKQDVEESKAMAGRLAKWGCQATEDSAQHAFLEYLLKGDENVVSRVIQEINIHKRNTWLESPEKSPLLHRFSGADKTRLLGRLGYSANGFTSGADQESPARPSIDLKQVAVWWKKHRDDALADFSQENYPNPDDMFESMRDNFEGTEQQRKAWITLFLRGALESMGRTRPCSHQKFLSLCKEKGWLERLVDDSSADELVKDVRHYVEEQFQDVPRFAWISPLLSLFLYKPWFNSYIESFLALRKYDSEPQLEHILSPKSNPEFSGGGPDAPPFQPLMGLGGYFVLRELVRNHILQNRKLHRLCYVPYTRIRRLMDASAADMNMEELHKGEQSRNLYDWIKEELGDDDCTFELDFDIALRKYGEAHDEP